VAAQAAKASRQKHKEATKQDISGVLHTDAITANVIATDAIDADAIAANAITSTEIADNAITANKIAADAITAAKVADGTIDAATFAAGAIDAAAIATNAVDADALATDAVNEIVDQVWNEATADHVAADSFGQAGQVLDVGILQGGTTAEIRLASDATVTNDHYNNTLVMLEYASGYKIGRFISDYTGSNQSVTLNRALPITAASGMTYWIYPETRGFDSSNESVGLGALNHPGATIPTTTAVTDAVTVDTLAADTITATSIQADAITAAKVADGTIDAATFAAGAIDAAAIATNAIDADAIAANAITSAKIATDAIGTAQIAAGTYSGTTFGSLATVATGGIIAASFGAGAIDAAAIATDAIGAAELAQDAAREIADEVLDRDIAGSASGGARNVRSALRYLRNRVDATSGSVLTVYQENDSTSAWTASITTSDDPSNINEINPQ
jgi:hypothetical protein